MSVIDYDVLKGATTSKTWEMDVKDMSHRTLETTSQTMLFRLIVADKQGINYLLCIWLIVAANQYLGRIYAPQMSSFCQFGAAKNCPSIIINHAVVCCFSWGTL